MRLKPEEVLRWSLFSGVLVLASGIASHNKWARVIGGGIIALGVLCVVVMFVLFAIRNRR
jgi:hypothetical protein